MRCLLAVVVLTACSPNDRDNPAADGPSQPDVLPDSQPPVELSRVYAHDGKVGDKASTLYLLNSATLATTEIGPITGLGNQSLTDLAIDKDDNMVGVTLDKLFTINPTTGAATLVGELEASNVTSLSFIPSDIDDPTSPDILVTANSFGEVFQIDPTTGASTLLGNYGTVAQGQVRSSGDLFGVHGLGIFATVDIGDGQADTEDYLAIIDPVTWVATPIGAGTGFDKIFGVGFWGGVIYGFVDLGNGAGGQMIQIDQNTGAGTLLSTSAIRWFGAGVATDAPVLK
jgi:hypothetical protein